MTKPKFRVMFGFFVRNLSVTHDKKPNFGALRDA